MVRRGCEAYLAFVLVEPESLESRLDEVPVVRKFSDVFLEELLGLPPEREIKFAIEGQLGTNPISILPYWMAPVELKELETQLRELLDKRFVRTR